MYVCHCRAVTDCTIRDSIAAGASDLCSLAEQCGAGSRCGGCHFALRQLLAEMRREAEGAAADSGPVPAPSSSQAA